MIPESEIENRYLQLFYEKATSGMEGTLEWVLWNRIVLQAGHTEHFVRECIVAIGAMLKSLESLYSKDDSNPNPKTDVLAKLHYDFAVMKYGKAIKDMRTVIANNSQENPRLILIGCLLAVCFELFLGDRHAAIAHAESGTIILNQWLVERQKERSKDLKMLSPSPATIEDEIVDAFQNLDIHITGVSDSRSDKIHRRLMDEHLGTVQHIPSSFSDLREARLYLNIVTRRTCHFMATTWSPSESQALARDFQGPMPGKKTVMTGVNIYSTSYKVTPELRIKQKNFATAISNWFQAFDPLFDSTCQSNSKGSKAHVLATRLRINAIAIKILCAGVVITNEMDYDAFNSLFLELITLIKLIVDPHHIPFSNFSFSYGGFHIDNGLTPHLFLIVIRCRDRAIRRDAIAVLDKWYTEGCWNPKLIKEIGLFMMEVEEEGVDWNEHKVIPENKRAIFSQINENQLEGRAILQCAQKMGGPDGGPVWKEKTVSW